MPTCNQYIAKTFSKDTNIVIIECSYVDLGESISLRCVLMES